MLLSWFSQLLYTSLIVCDLFLTTKRLYFYILRSRNICDIFDPVGTFRHLVYCRVIIFSVSFYTSVIVWDFFFLSLLTAFYFYVWPLRSTNDTVGWCAELFCIPSSGTAKLFCVLQFIGWDSLSHYVTTLMFSKQCPGEAFVVLLVNAQSNVVSFAIWYMSWINFIYLLFSTF